MAYGEMAECSKPRGLPIREILVRKKQTLEEEIKDIDRALVLYDNNPDIEELSNLVRRLV